MKAHYLYRCYDADGTLLYVGLSSNVAKRMTVHLGGRSNQIASKWLASCIDRYDVSAPILGREAGRQAERKAIRTEQPLLNIQDRGIPGWLLFPEIARYLIGRDLLELALATACTCWTEDLNAGSISPLCAPHTHAREIEGLVDA